jgi:glycosyltransferase involved in cell wall biosynthesis
MTIAQRILICFHDFPYGGTERIAIAMAKYWVEAGRDVAILCGTEAGVQRATVDPRVPVYELDPPITRSALSRFKLGREMGKRLGECAPDLIFLPGNFHLFLANNLRKADPRPAIALKISNPPVAKGVTAPLEKAIFRHFAAGVDALAPMNTGLARDLRAMLPNKSVTTLYDPIFVTPPTARQPRTSAKRQILWAGRLEPQKDVPLALATIKALNAHTPAHLTLLGDGSLRAQTERQITAMGLSDCVTLAGHVPSIDGYLANADALLITSHFEGGPAVAVEALAHGVPLVSTDCSYLLHDILTDPAAGQIVSSRTPAALADALAVVSATRPAAATLRTIIEPFDPARCAQAYLDWFDEIIVHRRGATP